MLGKLLKHEFRATGRILLPLYALLLLTAGILRLFLGLAGRQGQSVYDLVDGGASGVRTLHLLESLSAILFAVTMVGVGVLTLVLMVYRFYKNLMTDEGYLMFTLPVTTGQILWSKLITAMVWTICTVAAELLALLLVSAGWGFWGEVMEALRQGWQVGAELFQGRAVLVILEMLLTMMLGVLGEYLVFYAAIALGHSFANRKILYSVLLYIGFSTAVQTLGNLLGMAGIVRITSGETVLLAPSDVEPLIHTTMLGAAAIALAVAAIFYVVTHLTLKKRLNLQ